MDRTGTTGYVSSHRFSGIPGRRGSKTFIVTAVTGLKQTTDAKATLTVPVTLHLGAVDNRMKIPELLIQVPLYSILTRLDANSDLAQPFVSKFDR